MGWIKDLVKNPGGAITAPYETSLNLNTGNIKDIVNNPWNQAYGAAGAAALGGQAMAGAGGGSGGGAAAGGGWSGWAAPLVSFGGQLFNMNQQRETNKMNQNISREQMAFQERMSSTAHQREVKDLIAAGINPNLSAGGAGASSPSGASSTAVAPQIDMPGIFSTYTQLAQLEQNQQRINIDKAKATADISKKGSEQDLIEAKKILAQKGMPRAQLEGEASEILKNIIKYFKAAPNTNTYKGPKDYFHKP